MPQQHKIRPVIMSGGSGTRMWPLSRKARPKQFHRLISNRTLFQETVLRVSAPEIFLDPIILAAAAHETLIREELKEIGVKPARLILEPSPKNTAPAIAAMALASEAAHPGEIMVVLPADHEIADAESFAQALAKGAPHAADGAIVIFGVKPSHPETGYGYIHAGAGVGEAARDVAGFKEKPDLETAERYLASGDYFWNAGIFMFRSDVLIDEMQTYAPDILAAVDKAVEGGEAGADRLLLDAATFSASPENSIDYAVMEQTDKAVVIPIDVGWSDVGSWAALWEATAKDERGNVGAEEAIFLDCADTLAVSSGPKIAAIGVSDLLIVATPDGVLVAPRDKAQDVKKIVARLKETDQSDLL